MASSQVLRSYAPSARRRRGDKSRSGCSATSRNRVPLAQTNPWLIGCSRSGRRRTGCPDASRSASKPHAASQMRQNVGTERSGVWYRVMDRECTRPGDGNAGKGSLARRISLPKQLSGRADEGEPTFSPVAKRENPNQCYAVQKRDADCLAKICNNNTSHHIFSFVLGL